jgi:hypothetical protein
LLEFKKVLSLLYTTLGLIWLRKVSVLNLVFCVGVFEMEQSLQRLLQVSIDLRNQMAEIHKLRAAIQSAEASKQYQVRQSRMRLPAVSAYSIPSSLGTSKAAKMISDGVQASMAPNAMASKVVMVAPNFVAPQTLNDRKTNAATDTDEMTSADLDRLRTLEEMMHASGYVRSRYGFWITPGVEMKTERSQDIEYADAL